MDLRKVRADIGVVAGVSGFNAFDYVPDDPKDLPAAVVGGIKSMVRLNAVVTQVELGVTFYVSAADPQDSAARLDLALSTGLPDSFIDNLDSVTPADGASWRSIRFQSAGPYIRYQMPGGGVALGVDVVLELTA